jgi:O-antigen/teichoic acid export membrane protein
MSVGARTIKGMFWAYGSYVGGKLLLLISTVILARVLTRTDFGLVALALTFMTFLDTVRDLGLGQALIVGKPEELAARSQTVFSWSIVLGFTLSALTAAASPAVSAFFHQGERFALLLSALGLDFVLRSLGATHYALARKELDYRSRTFAELSEVVTRGVSSIVLALLGFGPWSLVLGYIIGVVSLDITVWVLVDFRPKLRFSREHLRELMTFGGTLTAVDVGAAIAHQLDYVFVGRVLGPASLALYTIGYRLPELLIINIAVVAGDVLFPAYALIDHTRLRDAFLLAMRSTAFVVFPLAVGLAILARPITLALFPKYVPSIEVMQVLVVYAVVITLSIPSGTVFKATGQAWILLATTIPYIVLLFTSLLLFSHDGIVAVALCMAGLQTAFLWLTWLIAARRLEVAIPHLLRQLVAPGLAAAGLAAVLYPIERTVHEPWLALLAGAVVGGAVYVGLVWVVGRDMVLRLRDTAFAGRG